MMMFDVNPIGRIIEKNCPWLSQLEKGGFTHWVIHKHPEGNYRALFNGLTYWVKVFREMEDGSLLYLFDLTTEPEYDEEYNECYLPNVTEHMIREFLGWYEE